MEEFLATIRKLTKESQERLSKKNETELKIIKSEEKGEKDEDK